MKDLATKARKRVLIMGNALHNGEFQLGSVLLDESQGNGRESLVEVACETVGVL